MPGLHSPPAVPCTSIGQRLAAQHVGSVVKCSDYGGHSDDDGLMMMVATVHMARVRRVIGMLYLALRQSLEFESQAVLHFDCVCWQLGRLDGGHTFWEGL